MIESYLALISDPTAELADIEALLDPELRFVERPNLVSPRGSERDRGQVLGSVEVGRKLLRDQSFDVVDTWSTATGSPRESSEPARSRSRRSRSPRELRLLPRAG